MKLLDARAGRDALVAVTFVIGFLCATAQFTHANPYLAKAGEPMIKVRVGTCAVTGGFIHLYAALDSRVLDKYGSEWNMSCFEAVPWPWPR